MSKFSEKTLERLEKWCEENNTQFTKFSWEEKNGVISIFNYDGHGFPHQINSFFSNKEVENFLDGSKELEKELDEFHEILEKEMNEN
ncbi:hypothetical protein [Clostridium sp.]|uniref:hypothetical protein n=1 Tax=Clostridium sp. TaxID=1506 RepID=UPI002913C822|nr:hypothetical protein [Clostridium sp.]MDU4144236.1 hypothetical protein [Clostridium sp.]